MTMVNSGLQGLITELINSVVWMGEDPKNRL